jgi:hypothetical protein
MRFAWIDASNIAAKSSVGSLTARSSGRLLFVEHEPTGRSCREARCYYPARSLGANMPLPQQSPAASVSTFLMFQDGNAQEAMSLYAVST